MEVNLVCLLETRVKENKMKEIVDKWFPNWSCLQNYSYAVNGRIWLLWKDAFQVSLSAATDQSIIVNIKFDSQSFFFTNIWV